MWETSQRTKNELFNTVLKNFK